MEKRETVGGNANGNMVIRGECVSACAYLKERGIQVDLVYIAPPFASGADYAKKVYIRRNPKAAEMIARTEQEHCDIGINSIQTARDRLKAGGAEFDVLEIRYGVQLYRNPVQKPKSQSNLSRSSRLSWS